MLAAAAAAAKQADVAIVFAYQWESEGFDLPTLDLAEEQNKLIEAVAAANPRTIVVLETGSPPPCRGSTRSPASSRPGIRESEAAKLWPIFSPAKVIPPANSRSRSRRAMPTCRIPRWFCRRRSRSLNFLRRGRTSPSFMAMRPKDCRHFEIYYDEELKVGYKWYDAEKKAVLFPFGFGLSYTTYAYSGLVGEKRRLPDRFVHREEHRQARGH